MLSAQWSIGLQAPSTELCQGSTQGTYLPWEDERLGCPSESLSVYYQRNRHSNPLKPLVKFYTRFYTSPSLSLTATYIVRNNYIVLFQNTHLLSVFGHYIKSVQAQTRNTGWATGATRPQKKVKSWRFICHGLCFPRHPPHVSKSAERMTRTLSAAASLTRIWLYVFHSGLCGLRTASSGSSGGSSSNCDSMVFLSSLLPPSLPLASLPPGNFQKILESATSLFL